MKVRTVESETFLFIVALLEVCATSIRSAPLNVSAEVRPFSSIVAIIWFWRYVASCASVMTCSSSPTLTTKTVSSDSSSAMSSSSMPALAKAYAMIVCANFAPDENFNAPPEVFQDTVPVVAKSCSPDSRRHFNTYAAICEVLIFFGAPPSDAGIYSLPPITSSSVASSIVMFAIICTS